MQNRYVGDIGDFAKYGLLRALARGTDEWRPRLAVIWYLVPDEGGNSDGRHTRYLTAKPPTRDAWQRCDSDLYEVLRRLVRNRQRSVHQIESSNLLPNALFFTAPLAFERREDSATRARRRAAWSKEAEARCSGRDLVFLDPDNGLEVKVDRLRKKGPKYAYYDDLTSLGGQGRSLMVYQHATRQGPVIDQVRRRLQKLGELFPDREPFGLYFRPVSPRAFLILPSPVHAGALCQLCEAFVQGPWGAHFQLVEPMGDR